MKKFLVVLLACAMIFGFASTAMAADTQIPEFSDIADQPQAVKTAMQKLAVLGVLVGNDGLGGPIRPADNLTRAEFAKIVAFLTNSTKVADAMGGVATRFTDVPAGMWYTGYVNAAAQSGYYLGDPEGTFRPNDNITMQEVVTVALRCAGYTDMLPGTWPANYVNKATNVGILDDVTLVGSAPATRADMALICNAVLGINMVVHINNEIAFAQGLAAGNVDADGFAEVYYMSNEDEGDLDGEKEQKLAETILRKAFGCVNPRYVFEFANENKYDEVAAWEYVDFADGELQFNFIHDSIEVASNYYINKDYTLPMLGGIQADVVVHVDDDEVLFVNVRGTTVTGNAYEDSNGRVIVGGKTYRPSEVLSGKPAEYVNMNTRTLPDNSDDAEPAKIYLDKDGLVYAVRTYTDYDTVGFGIFDEIKDSKDVAYVASAFASGTPKFDISKDYVLIKDNKLVKAEDLDRLDVLYYLGEVAGIKSWLALGSVEGELKSQNHTNAKLTIGESAYKGVANFMFSDDGGDGYKVGFSIANESIDSTGFGEAIYTMSYNWTKLAAVAANVAGTKVIGVVTNIDPGNNYTSGPGADFQTQYTKVTITNMEGKSQTLTFHKDFRNIYNMFMASPDFSANLGENGAGGGTGIIHPAYADQATALAAWNAVAGNTSSANPTFPNKGEAITAGGLKKGDIVQFVLDKDDAVKRIANYASFQTQGNIANDYANFKVSSASEQITISVKGTVVPGSGSASDNTSRGAYALPSTAVVFCAIPDGASFDDVKLVSVASVLASDFTAHKGVAFDVKSSGALNVLYYVGDTSNVRVGVINSRHGDVTNTYYTINGEREYSDNLNFTTVPALVYYTVGSGDVTVTSTLVHNNGAGALTPALSNAGDYAAVSGKVDGYYSGTTFVVLDTNISRNYRITEDTYIYDMLKKEAVEVGDLKDTNVVIAYDTSNYEAVAIAIYNKPVSFVSKTNSDTTVAALGLVAPVKVDSSDPTKATVKLDGDKIVITSVAVGSTTITITETGGAGRSATITVVVAANGSMTITENPYSVAKAPIYGILLGAETYAGAAPKAGVSITQVPTIGAGIPDCYTTVARWDGLNGQKFPVASTVTSTIILTAKEGYTFTGSGITGADFTFPHASGATATIAPNGSTLTVVVTFPVAAKTAVTLGTLVASTGTPASGATLVAPGMGTHASYTVDTGVWAGDVTATAGQLASQVNGTATYTITLTATEGNEFSTANITALQTMGHATSIVATPNADNTAVTVVFTYTW